jgi:hypothetical protein
MKMKSLVAALLVCAAPAAFAQEAAAPAAPAPKQVPQTPEAWLARMTDMTQNMSAYKDPKVFVPLVERRYRTQLLHHHGQQHDGPGQLAEHG